MKNFIKNLAKVPTFLLKLAISAELYILLTAVGSVYFVTYGTYLLTGAGVAYIVLGTFLLAFAILIARGVRG